MKTKATWCLLATFLNRLTVLLKGGQATSQIVWKGETMPQFSHVSGAGVSHWAMTAETVGGLSGLWVLGAEGKVVILGVPPSRQLIRRRRSAPRKLPVLMGRLFTFGQQSETPR
jgi:hypothetical protein